MQAIQGPGDRRVPRGNLGHRETLGVLTVLKALSPQQASCLSFPICKVGCCEHPHGGGLGEHRALGAACSWRDPGHGDGGGGEAGHVLGTWNRMVADQRGPGRWQGRDCGGGQGAGRLSLAGSLALTILSHKTQGLTLLTSRLPCGRERTECGGAVRSHGHLCPWRGRKEGWRLGRSPAEV